LNTHIIVISAPTFIPFLYILLFLEFEGHAQDIFPIFLFLNSRLFSYMNIFKKKKTIGRPCLPLTQSVQRRGSGSRQVRLVVSLLHDFLSFFLSCIDISTRHKLAKINEKLTALERQMEYLELALQTASGGSQAEQGEAAGGS
jgi:hypothetical protein